nr:serine/threonine-protein kinase [Glycomyces sp. L485]
MDDRLAAGGMGEVWRGTDTRLNRVVAIKLLHSGLSGNDRFRARFHQEAQAVAALQSPGIVALYDYGEEHSPEGLVSYLIMELVQGQSLAALIHQRGRLSPAETMKIMATAAEALDVAHRAHIIHRDVKPANLLVNEEGAVKIVDFGIASARGQAGLTETGTVMGTLSYASPEQLAGGDLSGATDLYSLGIVAYECLCGRTPFPGNDPAAVITAHMTGQPAPLPPDVPQPVAQIVMRCLAKDPRQRFGSAGELAQACRTGRPGSGTTAMLTPAPPGETSPATRPMAHGAVPASTGAMTQAMSPGDQSPPPGRDLPPPRDFEEPQRSKTVPLLITVTGVLVLIVALVMLQPWSRGADDTGDVGDGNNAAATPADAEDSPAADESTAEQEQQGSDQEDEEDDESDDESEEIAEETSEPAETGPELAELPDVTGDLVEDAIAELNDEGFGNVVTEPVSQGGAEEIAEDELCRVDTQSPPGETDAGYPYNTEITLRYWNDPVAGCGV